MVMNAFDTDRDGENNFYTVNGPAFYYARYPIKVKRSQTVRIYIANLTEFDLINSFHLHGDFFRYYPTGTGDRFEYTDVMLCQGERGIIEIDFANTGRFMFHAHQSEFAEAGLDGLLRGRGLVGSFSRRGAGPSPGAAPLAPLGSSIVLLVAVVSLFAARGDSLLNLVGEEIRLPPTSSTCAEWVSQEIRIHVTNPSARISIATVTVDDDRSVHRRRPHHPRRLRSAAIVVPYAWVQDEPISVGITSSTGIQTTDEIAAAWSEH